MNTDFDMDKINDRIKFNVEDLSKQPLKYQPYEKYDRTAVQSISNININKNESVTDNSLSANTFVKTNTQKWGPQG